MLKRTLPLLGLVTLACAAPLTEAPRSSATPSPTQPDVGVLVMAHGGGDEWNRAVEDAVAPLSAEMPTAVAFGMASPRTLSAAMDSLTEAGVGRVAVVRVFLSGRSFLQQTEYLLGLSPEPPTHFVLMDPKEREGPPPAPIRRTADVATHPDGLMVSSEARTILAERARELSTSPRNESVLVVAHGMGDEAENDAVLDAMEGIAKSISELGFASVDVATLREDWAGKRQVAEEGIRSFVSTESAAGRRVIVLPMRLFGFGPYAEVLDGLDYAAGEGLLPHDEVSEWVRATASRVVCTAGWGPVINPCALNVEDQPN